MDSNDHCREVRQERRIELGLDRDEAAAEAQMKLDTAYYKTRLQTLKTSLQRELNNDPRQYFKRLYQEIVQWNEAHRPPRSPVDHPKEVFRSLSDAFNTMWSQLWMTTGVSPIAEALSAMYQLTNHLLYCVLNLENGLREEDSLTDENDYVLQTLDKRHSTRRFEFQASTLVTLYEAASM
ncbi:hypothetical protein V5O48_014381 [Marasmius crinis-equi]|uniref:Uncharacterized protein n=1 Tax=Marasmius crinis-equi TaxID=585013 RepID=A0ABR3EXG2_9AGAR